MFCDKMRHRGPSGSTFLQPVRERIRGSNGHRLSAKRARAGTYSPAGHFVGRSTRKKCGAPAPHDDVLARVGHARVGTGASPVPGGAKLRSASETARLQQRLKISEATGGLQAPLRYPRPHLESNLGRRSSVGRAADS